MVSPNQSSCRKPHGQIRKQARLISSWSTSARCTPSCRLPRGPKRISQTLPVSCQPSPRRWRRLRHHLCSGYTDCDLSPPRLFFRLGLTGGSALMPSLPSLHSEVCPPKDRLPSHRALLRLGHTATSDLSLRRSPADTVRLRSTPIPTTVEAEWDQAASTDVTLNTCLEIALEHPISGWAGKRSVSPPKAT